MSKHRMDSEPMHYPMTDAERADVKQLVKIIWDDAKASGNWKAMEDARAYKRSIKMLLLVDDEAREVLYKASAIEACIGSTGASVLSDGAL